MNANSDVINKTSIASKLRFNMVYLAVASVISLSACTSSNQRELEEQVAAKEAKEQAQQLEMDQVTGSRLNKQQERQKQHAMKLRQQAMPQALMADSSAVILSRSVPPAPPQQPTSSENY